MRLAGMSEVLRIAQARIAQIIAAIMRFDLTLGNNVAAKTLRIRTATTRNRPSESYRVVIPSTPRCVLKTTDRTWYQHKVPSIPFCTLAMVSKIRC
jgi:hypothetical protein